MASGPNTAANPYNFRRPVTERGQLVGRDAELAALREAFKAVLAGTPVDHLLLTGPPRRGVTSLLNVGAQEARDAGLLPVVLDVTPLLFDSDLGFFRGIVDAAAVSLASDTDVSINGDRYRPLSSLTSAPDGDAHLGPSFYLAGASDVSPPLIRSDITRVAQIANDVGHGGVAFFLDNAQYLFEQAEHAVLEVFDGILGTHGPWVFVLGGSKDTLGLARQHSYSLFQRFRPLEMRPLFGPSAVREILMASQESDGAGSVDMNTAFDLMLICGGEPYWLKFGANQLWEEANDGDMALSPALIRGIAESRRGAAKDPAPLDESIELMDVIDAMDDVLVEGASRLAPFEAMTLFEYVLAQRASDLADGKSVSESPEDDLATAKQSIDKLVDEGVLNATDDRFEVAGGFTAKTYLRYEAARRAESPPISAFGHSSYGTAAAPSWLERLATELDGVGGDHVATYLAASEDPGDESGVLGPLVALHDAVRANDAVAITTAGFVPSAYGLPVKDGAAREGGTLAYVGIVFEVGVDEEMSFVLQRVGCGWMRWVGSGLDSGDCAKEVHAWLTAHKDELASYRLRVERVVAGAVAAPLAEQAVALMAPGMVPDITLDLYKHGRLEEALTYLNSVIPGLEKGLTADGPWRYDRVLSDAYIRLGFMAAVLGRKDDAWAALCRCDELENGKDGGRARLSDQILNYYNMAYVRGLRGEFAAAADLAKRAHALVADLPVSMYLLLYLPTITGWSPPNELWNVVSVEPDDVAAVIHSQVLCYEALSGRYSAAEFGDALAQVGGNAGAACRVFGWVWISRFTDPMKACGMFEMAEEAAPSEVGARELEFAGARCASS